MGVSLLGMLVGIAAAVTALVALAHGGAAGGARGLQAWVALAVGALPFVLVAPTIVKGTRVPRINDVTTNVEDPPVFEHLAVLPEGKSMKLDFPASFGPQIRSGYPDLAPVELPGTPDEVFDRARRIAQTMPGWAMTAADPAKRTIEASQETGVFHFVDDVVIRVRPDGAGTVVDVRSRSREGKGDFGVNAARIRAYVARLKSP